MSSKQGHCSDSRSGQIHIIGRSLMPMSETDLDNLCKALGYEKLKAMVGADGSVIKRKGPTWAKPSHLQRTK